VLSLTWDLSYPLCSGADLVFTVNVANQSVTGIDSLTYPVQPTITGLDGCTAAGDGLHIVNCPTRGGSILTVHGTSFASPFAIVVNSILCPNSVPVTQFVGTCSLPPSAGVLRSIAVVSAGQFSKPLNLISYSPPVITQVAVCSGVQTRLTSGLLTDPLCVCVCGGS
jgi:hypothetical protein